MTTIIPKPSISVEEPLNQLGDSSVLSVKTQELDGGPQKKHEKSHGGVGKSDTQEG